MIGVLRVWWTTRRRVRRFGVAVRDGTVPTTTDMRRGRGRGVIRDAKQHPRGPGFVSVATVEDGGAETLSLPER
jgi:hypothetical protein